MKDDILQMPHDAFPAHPEISDTDSECRENAGAEIRGSAGSSASEASDLPDGFMDAPQVADYPRVSETSVCKLTERQEIPARACAHQSRLSGSSRKSNSPMVRMPSSSM